MLFPLHGEIYKPGIILTPRVEAARSDSWLLPLSPSLSRAELRALSQLCLTGRTHRNVFKNIPEKSSCGGGREGSAISHSIPSSGRQLLDIFFSPSHLNNFFNLGFGAGRETKPVPEASHTLLPVGKEGEFLHPSFPSPLFPAPDKEGVSSPEPGAGLCRWPISTRVTQPLPVDLAVAQPRGHWRAEGEAEPVFPYGSLFVGKFSLHFVGLGLGFFVVVAYYFFFNVLPRFPSYLTPAKGQRGKFHFPGSISRVIPGLSKHFPHFLWRYLQIPTTSHSNQQILTTSQCQRSQMRSSLPRSQMPAEHCRKSLSLPPHSLPSSIFSPGIIY